MIRIIKSFKTCSTIPILIILYHNNFLKISTLLQNLDFPFFPLINLMFVLASVSHKKLKQQIQKA